MSALARWRAVLRAGRERFALGCPCDVGETAETLKFAALLYIGAVPS